MPTSIRALTQDGHQITVPTASISALMPDRADQTRTRMVADGEIVFAEGRYEDWMQEFASAWQSSAG